MLPWIFMFKFLFEHVPKVHPLPMYISILLSFIWLNNSIYVQLTLENSLEVYSYEWKCGFIWDSHYAYVGTLGGIPQVFVNLFILGFFFCSSDWIILIDINVGSPYRSFACTSLLLSPSVNFCFTYCVFQLLLLLVSLSFLSHHWYSLVGETLFSDFLQLFRHGFLWFSQHI